MPASLCGTWDIISNDNLEGYMVAMDLQTRTSLPLPFRYQPGYTKDCPEAKAQEEGQEFEEFTKGLDNRQVKSLVRWEGIKLVCEQIGEKKNRGWAHWVEEDKLHLELYCEGEVCKQVFLRRMGTSEEK
ncbi:retinoid-binding protein 7a isoform X2 [Pungitius pungitius]|uniref:retinoid-binding protein 7a isoform X2 n=1 Tax=Pungitius pungitius TaxID=134920 RepID=UPI001886E304|nr:retinoid-binding protein 7a isoform X2 [Pungitius pungitius]